MGDDLADEDIAAWQSGWNVPAALLDDVVRRATGSRVARDARILEGHENEVHDVLTNDGQSVIVRVAWRPGPAFERERWPMEAARGVGIPVPEMLLVEHTTVGDQPASFNVQQKMSGVPIHRLRPSLRDVDLIRLTRLAGRLLASLHGIEPSGRGPIGPDGAVDLTLGRGHSSMDDLPQRTEYLVREGVDRTLAENALAVVLENTSELDAAPVRLTHGDWAVANILAEGDAITAVVDWGGGGGDPASELAGWDFWSNYGPTATDTLLEGYAEAGGCADEAFERRRLVYRVANLHDAMSHFLSTNRPDLLGRAIRNLELALQTVGELF